MYKNNVTLFTNIKIKNKSKKSQSVKEMPVWQLLYIHLGRSRHPYCKCTYRRTKQNKSAAGLTAVVYCSICNLSNWLYSAYFYVKLISLPLLPFICWQIASKTFINAYIKTLIYTLDDIKSPNCHKQELKSYVTSYS